MALSMITDRTVADVTKLISLEAAINANGWASLSAADQAIWVAGKGTMNAVDLNRIGAAVATLAASIAGYGYPISIATPVTNWVEGTESMAPSECNAAQAKALLANVTAVKAAFYGLTALPTSMNNMRPTDANNIELALLEIEQNLNNMILGFRKSGTFTSGQGVILP